MATRERTALERIRYMCPEEGYYVAYSGGKDSTVLLDLVRRSGVKYDAHYNLTTVDPPELVDFIRTQKDVEIDYPKHSMWWLIEHKLMPPTRMVRYCCSELKERGGTGRLVMTGIRWAESSRRAKRMMTETCYKDGTKTYFHPIIDWADRDVWGYIRKQKLPYCSLYDEGFKRLGCILCPMAGKKQRLIEAKRWPQYKKAYLNTFTKMLAERERRGKETQWKTAEEVYQWWLRITEEEEAIFLSKEAGMEVDKVRGFFFS